MDRHPHKRIPNPSAVVGTSWRPWNVDSWATVLTATATNVTIRYDHAPDVYTLNADEFLDGMGRVVPRIPVSDKITSTWAKDIHDASHN